MIQLINYIDMVVKHKILILFLKYIPIIIATLYFITTLVSMFTPAISLSWLYGMSLLPLLFLYAASYAFSFCNYHRIFLHYIAIVEVVNWLDWVFKFPIETDIIIIAQLILFIACSFIALYLHMNKHEIRIIKTRT